MPSTEERIRWRAAIPFAAMHLACLLAIRTGVSRNALLLCAAIYVVRMFGITAGYHRYFAHRSFRTTRFFQFVLAWLGASAAQKGPLWWAAHHPDHRRFWWSRPGWFLCPKYDETDSRLVRALATYPELRFLNRFYILPPAFLAGHRLGFRTAAGAGKSGGNTPGAPELTLRLG